MAQDYANNILEAIEMLAEKKVNEAGYDKTIKAAIVSTAEAAKGKYTCQYGAVTFTAFGTEKAYKVNDVVMVNIPQNNWDNVKMILNKVHSEVVDYGSADPFDDFLDVNDGKPLITFLEDNIEGDEVALKANLLQWTSRTLVERTDFNQLYSEPFTRMGLQVAFKTKGLKDYRVNGGTYGVRVIFYNTDTNTTIAQYELNTLNFFGNLYGFEDYSPQKVLVTLNPEAISKANAIRLECFQLNDFTRYNDSTGATETLTYTQSPENVPYNIFFRDASLYFGYGKEEYKDGDVILVNSSPLQYYKKWTEEENTKLFSWTYWYKDSNGNMQRSTETTTDLPEAFLEYCINEKDWINTAGYYDNDNPKSVGQGGGEYSFIFNEDYWGNPSIQFRIRISRELFNTDSNQRYENLYSNIITFYQYEPVITSEIIDETEAIELVYEYEEEQELKYNDMENQLYNQYEFLIPHTVRIKWRPSTASYNNPNYLAGATITWKVPAFNDEYTQEENKYDLAIRRFNFETSTVLMRPRPGYEYGSNNVIRFEEIDNIPYMVWDVTLGDDFIYDENRTDMKYYWGDSAQTAVDSMRGLNFYFRPKQQYLPTMVNNTIYCVIKKGDKEFTSSIKIPIDRVKSSETKYKTFILTEDLEKPYLVNGPVEGYSYNLTEPKLFHFCTYHHDYDNKIYKNSDLNILRPFGSVFNETSSQFKSFLNNYEQSLGWCYSDESEAFIRELTTPILINTKLKYNFVLRQEVNNEIRYYLYHFNASNSNYTKYTVASTILSGGIYDPNETYYQQVKIFGTEHDRGYYMEGAKCIYEDTVYVCTVDNTSVDDWTPANWTATGDIIIEGAGTESKYWIEVVDPTEEEYHLQSWWAWYYIKTIYTSTLSNNQRIVFDHLSTSKMYSEVTPSPIARFDISGDKDTYIEEIIVPLLNANLIATSDLFKEGYWQYDNGVLTESESEEEKPEIKWYTLNCTSALADFYAFLMLQTKNNGICSIQEIPDFYRKDNEMHEEYYYIIVNGMNKIYCDASGVINENLMGPSELPFGQIEFSYKDTPIYKPYTLHDGTAINSPIILLDSYETNQQNIFAPTIESEKNEEQDRYYWYLKFDNIGFTVNYKEVGSGNEYPAESAKYYDSHFSPGYNYVHTAYLPIVFQQRQLFRDDFSQWEGTKVYIGEDAVFSPVIGAGRKRNGEFSGCLMGDVSTIDYSTGSSTNLYGLYGYKDNIQSFGLRADGTMFIGKAGNGQLLLNGNKATIQSSLYSSTDKAKGMLIDFDDGIIDMANVVENTSYYLKLDVSDGNVDSITDKPIKIGTSDSPKFSVEWDGTVHAKDIVIDGGSLSGAIEAANNATISNVTMKNSKMVNNNGNGLSIGADEYLHLDKGIILDGGGEIKANNGASLAVDGTKLTISGGLEISGGLKIGLQDCNYYVADVPSTDHALNVTTTQIDGQTVVTGVTLSTREIHYIGYQPL